MKEFFKQQLETLHVRTGLRQLENMMQKETWKEDVRLLISLMMDECERPPFDIVPAIVKQRVIERAILEDKDFIGLNPKFVRKSLWAWWIVNKDRVFEERNKKAESVYKKVPLTPEKSAEVDRMLDEYKRRILSDAGFRPVPKVSAEVLERDGAERQKATPYPVTSLSEAKKHELHLEYIRQNFDKYTADKLPTWKPEQEWVEGLSPDERKDIESRATRE